MNNLSTKFLYALNFKNLSTKNFKNYIIKLKLFIKKYEIKLLKVIYS